MSFFAATQRAILVFEDRMSPERMGRKVQISTGCRDVDRETWREYTK